MLDSKATKIRWSSSEYLLLAQALLQCHPLRRYDAVASYQALTFDIVEFNVVQRMALPETRQRIVLALLPVRLKLFEALVDLRPQAGLAGKSKRTMVKEPVKWSVLEWKQFAVQLHNENLDLHFLHSPRLDGLTTGLMNRACKLMKAERQRIFPALESPRAHLLAIYADARATRDLLFFPKFELPKFIAPEPQPVHLTPKQIRMMASARRAPPPVPETVRAFEINAHRPAVIEAAVVETTPTVNLATRLMASAGSVIEHALRATPEVEARAQFVGVIRWTPQEWLLLATELNCIYPQLQLTGGVTLRILSSGDVALAQRVLPLERQRPNLRVVSFGTNFLPKLTIAFEQLKRQIAAESAPSSPFTPPKETSDVAATCAVPDRLATATAADHLVGALASKTPVASINPYESAFKPLIDLFGLQLSAQLGAQVAAQIAPLTAQIAALSAQVTQLKSSIGSATFGSIFQADKLRAITTTTSALIERASVEEAPDTIAPLYVTRTAREEDAVREPHIGILGNRNKYKNDLEREFPGIRFTCIDSQKQIGSIQNCDKAIGMIRWCDHTAIHALKKAAGERFVAQEGAISELKRTLSIWIASGVIKLASPVVSAGIGIPMPIVGAIRTAMISSTNTQGALHGHFD